MAILDNELQVFQHPAEQKHDHSITRFRDFIFLEVFLISYGLICIVYRMFEKSFPIRMQENAWE